MGSFIGFSAKHVYKCLEIRTFAHKRARKNNRKRKTVRVSAENDVLNCLYGLGTNIEMCFPIKRMAGNEVQLKRNENGQENDYHHAVRPRRNGGVGPD